LSQGTHIRFADSDDDDGKDKGIETLPTNSKDNLGGDQDDPCVVDDLPLVFEAEKEKNSKVIEGETEVITILEERNKKRRFKRKTIRIIEKMPAEACTSSFLSLCSIAVVPGFRVLGFVLSSALGQILCSLS